MHAAALPGAATHSSLQVMMSNDATTISGSRRCWSLAVLDWRPAAPIRPTVRRHPGHRSTVPAPAPAPRADHARAAAQYESAGRRAGPAQHRLMLLLAAAREWLAAGRGRRCRPRAGAPQRIALAPAQAIERGLLNAEASLDDRAHSGSLAADRRAAASRPRPPGAQRFYLLKMRIALAAARPVDAVLAEMAGERLAGNAAERTGLRAQLLAGAARSARPRRQARTAGQPRIRWCAAGSNWAPSQPRPALRRSRRMRMRRAGARAIPIIRRRRCCRRRSRAAADPAVLGRARRAAAAVERAGGGPGRDRA